jgi:hypothetical protein
MRGAGSGSAQFLALLVETVTSKPQLLCLREVALIELRWKAESSWKAESICQDRLSPAFAASPATWRGISRRGGFETLDPRMTTPALAMTVIVHPDLSRPSAEGRRLTPIVVKRVRAHTKFGFDILTPQSITRSRDALEIIETSTYRYFVLAQPAMFWFITSTRRRMEFHAT